MQKLGQIFYGRGKNGYGILGVSPSGRPFADTVVTLCRAVGSPDRPGDVRPFLLSKRDGGHVIMVRACRGEDSTGRATLFFHALVAPEDALEPTGLDAFSLADKDAFVSELPQGEHDDLPFPTNSCRSSMSCSADLRFPAFVAAERPLNAEVRRMLGRETLSRNWATYSYNSLQGFDLCVHSPYAVAPASGNRYVLKDGHFIATSDATPPQLPRQKDQPMSHSHSFALKASLLANAALVTLLIVSNLRSGKEAGQPASPQSPATPVAQSGSPKSGQFPEMTEADARAKWEDAWKAEWRRSIRTSFEKRLDGKVRLSDFSAEIEGRQNLQQMWKRDSNNPNKQFLLSCKEYVDFVETEFFTDHNPN